MPALQQPQPQQEQCQLQPDQEQQQQQQQLLAAVQKVAGVTKQLGANCSQAVAARAAAQQGTTQAAKACLSAAGLTPKAVAEEVDVSVWHDGRPDAGLHLRMHDAREHVAGSR